MDCTELIRGLPIELRQLILKDLYNIKVRERADMGWNKVHEDIKKRLPINFYWAIATAPWKEHIHILRFFKECGFTDFNGALKNFASSGDLDAVKLCVEFGTDEYGFAL